jgi:tRNA uridine 5-carbamoylmethylation protein Kti12
MDSLLDAEPENVDEQTDLDLLVFGDQEMPASVVNHLPSILGHKKAYSSQIQEINIGEIESAFDSVVQNRILIVDDEPYNIDAMRIILQCATADK